MRWLRLTASCPLRQVLAAAVALVCLTMPLSLRADTGAAGGAWPDFALSMVAEVNLVREAVGVPALALDDRLAQAAQAHCEDMAANDFAGHRGSDGSFGPERGRRAGYPIRMFGENLQMGHTNPQDVVAAWMESPAHRENLLRPEVVHAGIGHVFLPTDSGRARYGHYWALVVAAPLP